ncbi:c-type cytochrome [Paenibacillus methanolicus]|uniref:Cytochrome c551 n=1 Tax=Paenibacillus methanolicus TaxID=582686 RepID=A0A5S5CJM5_9BACL|nr:cytochrome c [Paenibacillus methanolicus]TYP79714.1 cytochrome c551 [Paenibacillus methanolicus]
MKHAKLLILLLAFGLIISGCGGNNDNTGTDTGTTTEEGATGNAGTTTNAGAATTLKVEEIYKANCVSCHAVDLKGNMGPNSNLQQVGSRRTLEEIHNQITNGGNGMMAFKGTLSEEEIHALSEWLYAKK